MDTDEIEKEYREKQEEIQQRLEQFEQLRGADEYRLFKELVFVILTSRSSAREAWAAVEKLDELGLLETGSREEIAELLRNYDVQYERDKAGYIVANREELSQPTLHDPSGKIKLDRYIDPEDLESSRKELVEEIDGLGCKGASHFLRNIGRGNGFAIVSGHISRKLHTFGLRDSPEPPKSREEYMDAEQKFRKLSEETGIGIKELDLLLWSMETGEVFK